MGASAVAFVRHEQSFTTGCKLSPLRRFGFSFLHLRCDTKQHRLISQVAIAVLASRMTAVVQGMTGQTQSRLRPGKQKLVNVLRQNGRHITVVRV